MTRVSLRLLVSGFGLLFFSSQTAIAGHESLTHPAGPARGAGLRSLASPQPGHGGRLFASAKRPETFDVRRQH